MAIVSERPEKMKVLMASGVAHWKVLADESATLVAVANGPTYGGGIPIAPDAQWDDAQLDVCFVRAAGVIRLCRLLREALRAKHVFLSEVKFARADRVRIETTNPKEIYADGELVGRTPAEFSVLPRALRIIAP
jgi:diacylglycerol kinase (ATP)